MGWTQVWLRSAEAVWLELRRNEAVGIARAVEVFAAGASDDEPPGHLRVGRWLVGLRFEKDVRYKSPDGEELVGDVIWVVSLSIPAPDDVDWTDFFEPAEEDYED